MSPSRIRARPWADRSAGPALLAELTARLAPPHRGRVVWLPPEQAVACDHLRRFHRRFPDFGPVQRLLDGARLPE